MKTLHIASIFALSVSLTFACGDDDDTTPNGTAGSSGSAQAGDNGGGEGPSPGGAGGTGGAGAQAGAGGAPAEACEFGDYGAGGASDAGGAGGSDSAGLELIGTWEEEFIGTFEITSAFWGTSGIAAYDSDANLVYTQSPCDAEYNPGAFSKIVYTEPADDEFYYCTVVFGAKTLAEAQASEATADPEDLEAGCGSSGFPWSKVTKASR